MCIISPLIFFNHRARQKPLPSSGYFVCELDEGIKNFNTSPRFEKTLANSAKGARRACFFLIHRSLSPFPPPPLMVTWRFSSRLKHWREIPFDLPSCKILSSNIFRQVIRHLFWLIDVNPQPAFAFAFLSWGKGEKNYFSPAISHHARVCTGIVSIYGDGLLLNSW